MSVVTRRRMKRPEGKVRLAIDFRSPEQMLAFVDRLREMEPSFADADAFEMIALDTQGPGAVTITNTYVFRNARDRIPGTRLRDQIE